MDFVRYISLLSQYYKQNSESRVGMHYSGRLMENLYEEYIYNVVNDTNNDNFPDLKSIFPRKNYHAQLNKLISTIDLLGLLNIELFSIIDMDIYYFGLIYHVFFKKKELDLTRKNELLKKLGDKIAEIKFVDKDNYIPNFHVKNPAALKYLRQRMKDSIDIYETYFLP